MTFEQIKALVETHMKSKNTGGGKSKEIRFVKTTKRLSYKGRDRVIYEGARGGQYIMMMKTMIAVNKLA